MNVRLILPLISFVIPVMGLTAQDPRVLAPDSELKNQAFYIRAMNATAVLHYESPTKSVATKGKTKAEALRLQSMSTFSFSVADHTLEGPVFQLMPAEAKQALRESYSDVNAFCPAETLIRDGVEMAKGVFCSAVLISKRHILTAAHCVPDLKDSPGRSINVLFDYFENDQKFQNRYSFKFANILAQEFRPGVYDYAIIELDRDVVGREPVPLNLWKDPVIGEPLFALGFPYGVPMTYSPGSVLGQGFNRKPEINQPTTVKVDMNVYPGNSGGPAFQANGDLLGVVVQAPRPHLRVDETHRCFEWSKSDPTPTSYVWVMPVKLIRDVLGTIGVSN